MQKDLASKPGDWSSYEVHAHSYIVNTPKRHIALINE